MLKILFYNHTAKISGAEYVLMLILSQLNRQRFTPVALCPAGTLQEKITALGVPCHQVEHLEARFTWRPDDLLRYLISFYRVIRNVRQSVRQVRPDLIHANGIRPGLVMTAATFGLGVPVIWHLHDLLPHHPLSTLIRLFVLASSRSSMIAVSDATARRFRGTILRYRRAPLKTILNCVDSARFRPDNAARTKTRAELGLQPDNFVVGIIGQIAARKGQLGLLRAFATVTLTTPQARLLIVGEPLFTQADQEYAKLLRQTVTTLGLTDYVHFLGARSDVPAVMQALDLLVVNSLEEPCGLVVLEGMAGGLPIIATAVGGNPELLDNAVSGWLIPSQDDEALAHAIETLGTMPQRLKQLGANARRKACEQFTIAPYIAAVEEFYRERKNGQTQVIKQWPELARQPSTEIKN